MPLSRRKFLTGIGATGALVQIGLPPLDAMFDFNGTVYAAEAGGKGLGIDKRFLLWWNGTGLNQTCVLSPSTPYFLNIIDADISGVTPAAGSATSTANISCGATCMVPIQNGPGSWQSYTPH